MRFHVSNDCVIEFDDAARGLQQFKGSDIGDFIIRRADGTPPFMYCNAIDDACMGVTYALRGEDHLTNTPRQVMILKALNLPIPTYGHISLIIAPDGSPLSKRHGSRSIRELREVGFFPAAVNNYMARLGHYYENESFMTLDELGERFKLENLGRAPARFDYSQLLRWQQEAISLKTPDELWSWITKEAKDLVPEDKRYAFIATIRSNILFPQDVFKYANVFFLEAPQAFTLTQEHCAILKEAGVKFFELAIAAVDKEGGNFKAVSQFLQQELHLKGKALFQPLRIALTGELHGPEMTAVFNLLSTLEIKHRFQLALELS